ncbi:retrotransposon gag domain, retroviral aspartyl protease [Tanacetum coccineum]
MSDMTACLNDLSYIPLNNEQNEPTQGDIGETSNEPTQAIRNEFEELYASANEELYPGCDYMTRLDFMANFTYSKVKCDTCDLGSYAFACKDLEAAFEYPVCNTSRWKDSNTPGKKVPKKVLHYFLIIPRLQRLYKSSHTAKEMTWHATGKCTEPGKMQHPVDGRAWNNFDIKYPDFAKEPRNVRLGLAADGFNPFGNLSQSYSMWSVILTTYNLPPQLCIKESSLMLMLLIRGPKSSGKDIDVYLSSLSGWSGQGYKACPTCNEYIPSMRVLGKIVYVGHRRFLKKPHKWRRSLDFNGETKDGDPPYKFNRDQIMAQLASLPTRVQGVKLQDGFGSNFKNKVIDNDTNITGLKSHDCHIMMQRLLPYGLQQYLSAEVAKPIIELCSFFKQICSQTLMEDDMLKAQRKVVDILCNLELIYPPAFFDIMIHLVIHLPLEALESGPIRPRWMYLFERYMKKLKKLLNFLNQDMKEEFLGWFGSQIRQRHINKDPGVSVSSELFALACGPTPTPISVNSCVFNGVRFVVNNRDERRTTQNSGICSPGDKDGEMYYGQLEEILEFSHMSFKVVLFRVKWFDTSNEGRKVKRFVIRNNMTQIWANEDDHVIHFDNSSHLALSTSLNDLDFETLHIDGQSMDVDAPSDIIDVDEDDDIIDDDDALPHDLADSDDEDLVNVNDDDDVAMSADVAKGHGGDDRPPPHQIGGGCRGKGTRKPNLGGKKAGNTHKETRNLGLRKITDQFGPQDIREFPMHFHSWHNILEERKAGVMGKIGTQFDLTPHMQSDLWPKIKKGIEQHLAKIYTDNKSSLKAEHWVANPDDGTYDMEGITSRKHLRIVLQDRQMESSATREYPSLIHTYFDTHTVDGVFLRDEERLLWFWREGAGTSFNMSPEPRCTHTADVDELKRTNKQAKQKETDDKIIGKLVEE